MILLLFDSLLLIFISTSLGMLALGGLGRFLRSGVVSDPLGTFLTGLILSTIYFNIISFWLPVNYFSLLPILALSLLVFSRNKSEYRLLFFPTAFQADTVPAPDRRRFASRTYALALACVLLLLFCYWIKPSTSPDSRGYHFLAILWYEKFKVVPGLGNLHGRLAFNPVSFIISAAYSLTGLTGQSIYPLNGVLTTLFLLWILARVIRYRNSWAGLVYLFLLILLFRPLLAYMSSPSSEPLVLICIAYPAIRIFERLLSGEAITLPAIIVPLLVMLYAPLAKLSAYPLFPALACIFFLLPRADKKPSRIILLLLIAGCMYLPWLGRNYILSGYLAYPVPHTDLFHPDWKIPADMLQLDYSYGKYSARSDTNTLQDFRRLESLSFPHRFLSLLSTKWRRKDYVDLFLLLMAIFSSRAWVIAYSRKKKRPAMPLQTRAFIFWLAIHAGVWIWIVVSMDFRFGMAFLVLSFIFPLLALSPPDRNPDNNRTGSLKPSTGNPGSGTLSGIKITGTLASLLLVAATLYYLYGAFQLYGSYVRERGMPITLKESWFFPLKDARTYLPDNKMDFPYTELHSGVRLYLTDSCHRCTGDELPCEIRDYGWWLGKVEMRGNRLDQGFKNIGLIPQKERP